MKGGAVANGKRSLFGRVTNLAPVPYVGTRSSSSTLGFLTPTLSSRSQQLEAMGANGTVFAIVDATSQGVASATWHLYRKSKTGNPADRVEVTSHAALDLWRKPNPFFTQQELIEAGQQHQDLTGETWLVVSRNPRSTIPLELWPVKPDKMDPVPSPTAYLSGYQYNGPDGEKIPLNLDEVIFIRRPNPSDPYRGIGPVQSVLMDLDANKYSAEWNRNFFLNSAEPGGIIQVDRRLSDDEFQEMRMRWQEQHQGVAQAHRVALLEQGTWVDRRYAQKDMQFAELRTMSSEIIRQAFRFPVPMLGTSENVNRANADAAQVVFARWLLVPRLDRWKQALNNDLLPLFFPPGTPDAAIDVEFDYDTPVPEDEDAANQAIQVRAAAAVALIGAGFNAVETLAALELPEISWTKPAAPPVPPQAPPGTGESGGSGGGTPPADNDPAARALAVRHHHDRAGVPLLDADPGPAHPDLQQMQDDWESALNQLLTDFNKIDDEWQKSLLEQIKHMAASGSLLDLLGLKLDTTSGAALLESAMYELAKGAAHKVADEGAAQGVNVLPAYPRRAEISTLAQVVIAQLGTEIALSAGREAVRVSGSGTSADDVASKVGEHLTTLTDARPRLQLGGALTSAQHSGRISTLLAAPSAAYYSSEVLDGRTCKYCAAVNRRWLGNTLAEANALYPRAGYIDCEGGIRCRGTIVAVWRPQQVATP